jgi:hypothetical protein
MLALNGLKYNYKYYNNDPEESLLSCDLCLFFVLLYFKYKLYMHFILAYRANWLLQ